MSNIFYAPSNVRTTIFNQPIGPFRGQPLTSEARRSASESENTTKLYFRSHAIHNQQVDYKLTSSNRSSRIPKFKPHLYKPDHTSPQSKYATVSKGATLGQAQLKAFDDHHQQFKQEPIKIDLHEIRQAIDQLSLNQRLTIAEMLNNDSLSQAYLILQKAASSLYNTEYYEKSIISYLKTKPVYTVKPGTVGQFLFGNTRPDYGHTTVECSPVGIGALPADRNSKRVCPRQVWYYQNDKYQLLTKKTDDGSQTTADIYVPINFQGLTQAEIDKLAQQKVSQITIYSLVQKPNSEEQIAIKRTNLIPLSESSADKYAQHLLAEAETQLANNSTNQSDPSSNLTSVPSTNNPITDYNEPLVSNNLKTKQKTIAPVDHIWVWIILILIFIIIVGWIGYNISKQNNLASSFNTDFPTSMIAS